MCISVLPILNGYQTLRRSKFTMYRLGEISLAYMIYVMLVWYMKILLLLIIWFSFLEGELRDKTVQSTFHILFFFPFFTSLCIHTYFPGD